jgi:hypothetical protein
VVKNREDAGIADPSLIKTPCEWSSYSFQAQSRDCMLDASVIGSAIFSDCIVVRSFLSQSFKNIFPAKISDRRRTPFADKRFDSSAVNFQSANKLVFLVVSSDF